MKKAAALVLLAMPLLMPPLAWAEPAGSVAATEGTVFVLRADGRRRIVAPGSALEKGDTIQTEKDSTARVRFRDGAEMAVRPASTLVIQDYHYQEAVPEKDSMIIGLLRGGLRQLTGFIGKRGNQDAYKLNGATATIGIRGTDFTARVCQGNECGDAKGSKIQLAETGVVAAKAVEVQGKVTAQGRNGLKRALTPGEALYQDDLIESEAGAHAALVFSDETRVVVPPESSLRLSNYRYVPNQPEKSNMFLDVVRGSFRMVTGLLGKQAPQKVNVGAVTATIGIRGTVFDLACVPAGLPSVDGYSGGGAICGGGLLTNTRDGSISVTTGDGKTAVFGAGQTGFVSAQNQTPILLQLSPDFLKSLPGPLPERIKIDIPDTFGVDAAKKGETGLYVTVSEGKVVIAQAEKTMLLNAGETGFASGTDTLLQRLALPPVFLADDQKKAQQNLGFKACRM